jgi:hypothetical protein
MGIKIAQPGICHTAIYDVNGKQYIVIACGGGKLKTSSGTVMSLMHYRELWAWGRGSRGRKLEAKRYALCVTRWALGVRR